jgi:hypothetical protein
MTLRDALDPMLHLEPARWTGLPEAEIAQFDALFGPPVDRQAVVLGHYPADLSVYRTDEAARGLQVWARDGVAVMVQTMAKPDASVLATLPPPSAVLAHEILVDDAYAHEYLYCPVGLVLTVAQAYRGDTPDRILRCRGTRALASVDDFGPAYYLPFEDQIRWAVPRPIGAPA